MTRGTTAMHKSLIAAAVSLACAKVVAADLEEIVVTATRRNQNVSDIPYNITAVNGDELKVAGVVDIATLVQRVPGVSYTDRGARSGAFSSGLGMRGISVEDGRLIGPLNTAPAVATYIDETPLYVNLHLTDIDRVEVLRGPQGTLYGSGSMGGTLRFIHKRPSFSALEASIDANLSQTGNASGVNSELSALINVPLSTTLAVRANLGRSKQAGWIDRPRSYALDPHGIPALANPADYINSAPVFAAAKGTNQETTTYGRAAVRWQPNERWSAQLSYNFQKDHSDGNPIEAVNHPDYGKYDSPSLISEPFDGNIDLAALDVEVNLGFATLTGSASSYDSKQHFNGEITEYYQQFPFYAYSYGNMPRPLLLDKNINNDKSSVFELRLVSSTPGAIDWVAGAYFRDQKTAVLNEDFFPGYQDWADACAAADPAGADVGICGEGTTLGAFKSPFFNPAAGGPGEHPQADAAGFTVMKDQAYLIDTRSTFKDLALFGELSWHVNDRWQITGGLRHFDQKFRTEQVGGAVFVDSIARSTQSVASNDTLFKVNTSWKLADHALLYATWSEGFRRGGANALPVQVVSFGQVVVTEPGLFVYKPDRITNREIGIKGAWFKRVQYTAALFDIDWQDTQLDALVTPFALSAVINAGKSSSRGLELELDAQLSDQLKLNLGYAYTSAHLDTPNPIGTVEAGFDPLTLRGARLPGVSKHTASAALTHTRPLASGATLVSGLSGSYRSDYLSRLSPERQTMTPAYQIWNGFMVYELKHWSLGAYVDNLADAIGIINIRDLPTNGPRRSQLISNPRTIGVSFSYHY